MAITPKNGDLTAGVAGKWSETIDAEPPLLVTGDAPAQASMPFPVRDTRAYAARTVVALDPANGRLISPEVADGLPCIGFLVYGTNGEMVPAGTMLEVMVQGVFNPDALIFDVSYDTDEKKRMAFVGAQAPSAIIIRKPQTMTV